MVVNKFWVLLLGVKSEKLGIRLEKNVWQQKRRQHLIETDRGSCYKGDWLEKFFDGKGAFYNVNESDNNNEGFKWK